VLFHSAYLGRHPGGGKIYEIAISKLIFIFDEQSIILRLISPHFADLIAQYH